MTDAIKAAMTASITEVLETMFFMSTEISQDMAPADYFCTLEGKTFGGQIGFRGPSSGRYFILIPETVLATMTESFMAMEQDQIGEEHLGAMIKEVLNMVAGNTFSTYNPDQVYELGIPEMVPPETIAKALAEAGGGTNFLLVDTIEGALGLAVALIN